MNKFAVLAVAVGVVLVGATLVVSGASGPTPMERPPAAPPAPPYTPDYWRPPAHHAVIVPVIKRYLADLPQGSKVLDLGSSNGMLLGYEFPDRGWELHALDIDEEMVAMGRGRFPEIEFHIGDATTDLTAVLPAESFDAIVSIEVLEHVFDPAAMVRNVYNLLKPGGIAIISTPYHGYLKNVAIAASGGHDMHYQPRYLYGHIKFFSPNEMALLLWDAGFDDLEFNGTGRLPYLWHDMVFKMEKP